MADSAFDMTDAVMGNDAPSSASPFDMTAAVMGDSMPAPTKPESAPGSADDLVHDPDHINDDDERGKAQTLQDVAKKLLATPDTTKSAAKPSRLSSALSAAGQTLSKQTQLPELNFNPESDRLKVHPNTQNTFQQWLMNDFVPQTQQ